MKASSTLSKTCLSNYSTGFSGSMTQSKYQLGINLHGLLCNYETVPMLQITIAKLN